MKLEAVNDEFPARKYAKKKLHQLCHLDKLKIVHDVMVNLNSQIDTAKTFKVSKHLVSALILKVKKNPKFMEELKFEIYEKQSKVGRIKEAAGEILK